MPTHWTRGYTRKSRWLGDPDDPELMAHHVAEIRRMAAADGILLQADQIVMEVGSGESITDRSAFTQLLLEIEALPPANGGTLYCTEFSRLSRGSRMEWARIVDAISRAGIRIRTPERTYDPSSIADSVLSDIQAALARSELEQFRRRSKLKRDEMTRAGRVLTGGDRYGYRWSRDQRTLLPKEPEFTQVGEMFTAALTESCRQIGERLGLPYWQVARILRNPIYTGYPHRHTKRIRSSKGNSCSHRLPREEWFRAEQPGNYPAAVTVELFERVQQVLDQRYARREKTGPSEGWCRDCLRIIEADGTIHTRISLDSVDAAGGYLSYQTRETPRLTVSRDLVHQAARNALEGLLAAPNAISEGLRRYEERRTILKAQPEPRSALLARITRLRVNLDELLTRELDAEHPEEQASVARVREQKRRELDQLTVRLNAPEEPISLPETEWLERMLDQLGSVFAEGWAAMTEGEKRALVNCCILAIDVRCEREPGRHAWRREVVRVEMQPWFDVAQE